MALWTPELLPTKQYTFAQLRLMLQQLGDQPGVVGNADFKVSQRASSANLSVDVAAGGAWVPGGAVANQGWYHQFNDAVINVAPFSGGDATNPRIDQILLVVNDSSVAGASDTPQIVIAQGTATAGAQATNFAGAGYRSGAVSDATLTTTYRNWLRLADVVVPVNAASIVNANIVDRRSFARGAHALVNGSGNGTNYTPGGTLLVLSPFQARIECTGNPLRLKMRYTGATGATVSGQIATFIDGSEVTPSRSDAVPGQSLILYEHVWTPSVGSHVVGFAINANGGGSYPVENSSTTAPEFEVIEDVGQSVFAYNGVS